MQQDTFFSSSPPLLKSFSIFSLICYYLSRSFLSLSLGSFFTFWPVLIFWEENYLKYYCSLNRFYSHHFLSFLLFILYSLFKFFSFFGSFLQEVDSVSWATCLYFSLFCLCTKTDGKACKVVGSGNIVSWLSEIGICSLGGWIHVKYNGILWNCLLFWEAYLHYCEMRVGNPGKYETCKISRYEVISDCYLKSIHHIRRGFFEDYWFFWQLQ